MKKKWLLITIIIAALTIGGIASAQVTAPNLWKIVSGSIRPVVSSWELGSATSRIQKGWFTNLDASNATIGSIAVSGTVSGDMVVGGQIRAANGTSTAPAYSFNSDTNTGLMWTGNDAFKFINGGNDSLSISSAGQVKINALASSTATLIMADTLGNLYSSADNRITSASSPLVLAANNLSITKASSTASGYLSNTDWSTFNGKVSSQWTTSGSNIYYTTGSVGIGTTSPLQLLHVNGNSLFGAVNPTYPAKLNITSSVGGTTATGIVEQNFASNGIIGVDLFNDTGKEAFFGIGGGTAVAPYTNNFAMLSYGTVNLIFGTNGAEKVRIDTTGNVGIGTTNPGSKLDIVGTQATGIADIQSTASIFTHYGTMGIAIGHDTTSNRPVIQALSSGTAHNLLINPYGGNVGIGTTAPGEKLEVNGNIKATGYKSSDGTIGTSTTINVRKADDSGACTITVKNGLVTATTCP